MIAYLEHHGKYYFAKNNPDYGSISTPVTALIRGICSQFPETARSLLRSRIFTDAPLSELCHGTVAVAAKRITQLPSVKKPEADWIEIHEPEFPSALALPSLHSHDPMALALELCALSKVDTELFKSDRKVGAVLVSASGEILSAGINRSSLNRCFHAEVEAIFHFHRKSLSKIPKGASLFTTRKPCKMCAGTFWELAEDIRSNKIIYLEEDLGPLAKFTVFTPGSFERKRATRENFIIEFKATGSSAEPNATDVESRSNSSP